MPVPKIINEINSRESALRLRPPRPALCRPHKTGFPFVSGRRMRYTAWPERRASNEAASMRARPTASPKASAFAEASADRRSFSGGWSADRRSFNGGWSADRRSFSGGWSADRRSLYEGGRSGLLSDQAVPEQHLRCCGRVHVEVERRRIVDDLLRKSAGADGMPVFVNEPDPLASSTMSPDLNAQSRQRHLHYPVRPG